MKPIRASNSDSHSRLSWVVRNAAAREAEIDIFDVIGDPWDGTSAKDFITELRGITAPNIRLNINSPGGYVDDALAIYDAILRHPSDITAHITVAASAASFVAMAADKRVISKTGKIQIHDAHAFIGVIDQANAESIDNLIETLNHAKSVLNEESDNIASIYAERAGGSAADWRKRMQANGTNGTLYRGQEAVDIGLADELATTPARNEQPARIAAHVEEPDDVEVDPELFKQVTARGYEPPLPSDISRLIERNLATAKGGPR